MSDSSKKRTNTGNAGGPQKKTKGAWQAQKGGAEKAIPTGAVGIFATCDAAKDRRAADELIHLLEEAFSRMDKAHVGAGEQQPAAAAAAGDARPSSVDALLAAEVADLKDKKKDRFKRHDTGVRGTLFVEFPKADDCPSPEDVAVNIARHVKESQSLPARHLMRLLPVSSTCFVSTEDVTALAGKVAEQHFPKDAAPIEFAVEFEHRSCEKLKRKDVIDILAQAVPQPPHKVNLSTPKKSILVQLVRSVCAVAVVEDYKELLKLNLRMLVEGKEEAGATAKPATAQPGSEAAATTAGDKQPDEKQQPEQQQQPEDV